MSFVAARRSNWAFQAWGPGSGHTVRTERRVTCPREWSNDESGRRVNPGGRREWRVGERIAGGKQGVEVEVIVKSLEGMLSRGEKRARLFFLNSSLRTTMPSFPFEYDPTNAPYTIPSSEYISSNPSLASSVDNLASGALVFHDQLLLLVQRSSTDSMPNLWETPGGGIDTSDPSILHGLARELREEAGLETNFVGLRVGGHEHRFLTRKGLRILKLNFLVEAKGLDEGVTVQLDENEHQHFVWASEDDVRKRACGGVKLEFTTKEQEDVILEAFRVRKESQGKE